ncbi:glutamyl-tRNA(Gln) amidotransferase subunit B, mitochondrial-like [Ruditapes philippinarum]|uniref:glutamyl-tRNA(Gln) amidotransferase subunit B, mitochondrial-like n=1 Tax=Ruditapes philippinarum TaxID=129788 RepID=UPI00295B80C2|nr:glutamyl-tRNA(Gln) amidotransferase subunit B, mitochondrial-like [Ruditapes philippinarum]
MTALVVTSKRSICSFCGIARQRYVISLNKRQKRFKSTQLKQLKQDVEWQPVIGLEVHAQILADGKLFSGASSKYGAPVNSQVSFLDSALPGTLPVLNRRCVEAGVLTALALKCRINKVSRFDRKHYFYADLPAGYQITQQNHAIANDGAFRYIEYGEREEDCVEKSARILQLQLEQDSGKSLHDDLEARSLIDLNRAGIALMEIVTAPDFHTGNEARSFVRELRLLLVTLGTCNGRFSEGSIRVDANISVHRPGEPLGTRSEVKNINSINCLKKAIDFEIERQIEVLERGDEVVNETRSFDKDTGKTVPMRDKESKQDYRFMPEPNLPPLHLHSLCDVSPGSCSGVIIDNVEKKLPALPNEIRDYLMNKYGLNLYRANFIVNGEIVDVYEKLVATRDINKFTSFLINHFLNVILEHDSTFSESGISPESVGDLYDWYINEDLSLLNVQKIIRGLLDGESKDPKYLADMWNVWQINDDEYLTDVCKKIIQENPSQVAKIKKGKKRAINKLMGEARTLTSDRGNLTKMSEIFKKLIQD